MHLQISEVLNEEQQLGKAGEGFCAAVSLNDGELLYIYNHTCSVLYFRYFLNRKEILSGWGVGRLPLIQFR